MPIYLPEDQRWGQLGRGLGGGIGGIIEGYMTAKKQKEVTDYALNNPDATPEQLYGQAGSDLKAHDLVTTILNGRLHNQQMLESRERAKRDAAEIPRMQAQTLLDLTRQQKEQADLANADIHRKILELDVQDKQAALARDYSTIQTNAITRQKLGVEIQNLDARTKVLNSMLGDLSAHNAGPSPDDVSGAQQGPTAQSDAEIIPGSGGFSSTYVDRLDKAVSNMEQYMKTPQGRGYDLSEGGVTKRRGPAVSQMEESRADAMYNLASVLNAVNDSLVVDAKTHQLKLGPIKGAVGQLVAKFRQDYDKDPNVAFGTMAGHADIGASAMMPSTRMGFNILDLFKDILVTPKKGEAFNRSALLNSMRMITAEAAGLAESQTGRGALGVTPNTFREIAKIARQTIENDPAKAKAAALADKKKGADAPATPETAAPGAAKDYDPKKTYSTVGETFTINGKTYKVMKVDPNDPTNPDVEEVK